MPLSPNFVSRWWAGIQAARQQRHDVKVDALADRIGEVFEPTGTSRYSEDQLVATSRLVRRVIDDCEGRYRR